MARIGKDINTALKDLSRKITTIRTGEWLEKFFINRDFQNTLIFIPLKQRLFQRGVDGDGNKLPPYSKSYALFKKSLGKKTKPTTLRLTGDWYKSMFIHIGTNNLRHVIEIKSRDEDKTRGLKRKYSAAILQMTKKEQDKILSAATTEFIRIFEEDSDILFDFE